MNPFLEPTVAAPKPVANGRGRTRRTWRLEDTKDRPKSPPAGPASIPEQRPSLPRAVSVRAGSVLRTLALAGSLLLPGLAMGLDINTATPVQLQEIKGIGAKTANLIVEERNRGGRYESITDMSERVKGIGPKKAAGLQAAGLTVGAAGAAAAESAGRGSGTGSPRRGR